MGLTQEMLAEKAGVQQSQVSALENGSRIGDDSRERILAVLNMKPDSTTTTVAGSTPTPSPGTGEGMATLREDGAELLELALGHAFDADRHMLRDANMVLSAFGQVKLPITSEVELRGLCRQWLDAAAELRGEGVPITSASLSAQVSLRMLRAQ